MNESPEEVSTKVGKLLLAGFEGLTITPQARKLITEHKVGALILGRKNFENVPQIKKLIHDLQSLAKKSGYKYPLLLPIDQEGGMCNVLYDEVSITQFPGAMALAATGDENLVYEVAKAIGLELRSIGFNLFMGPVLDICSKMSNQLIGVRSFGSTVEDVSRFGKAFAQGLKESGLFVFPKHFPGIGSSFVDNLLELPMMLETSAQLECFNILPFKALIDSNLVDGVSAGGCAVPNISPNEIHACLSPVIVQKLLRKKLRFQGIVLSECLELEALCRNMGLGQGAITAILFARCDIVMVCHDLVYQEEAIESLRKAYVTGNYETIFNETLRRIENLQKKLDWDTALNGNFLTKEIWIEHQRLSIHAYQKSVTLVRDYDNCISIQKFLSNKDEENSILLLTPLITSVHPEVHNLSNHFDEIEKENLFQGEEVFRDLGEQLSKYKQDDLNYNVLHTSYTANGLTNLHENLIEHSKVVILLTADASRNLHQIGIAKHISILCGGYRNYTNSTYKKPLIIISVSSPYDFLYHNGIGSLYMCTYEYTSNVLAHISPVLFGETKATGVIPGEAKDIHDSLDDMLFYESSVTSPLENANRISPMSSGSITSNGNNVNKSLEMILNDTSANPNTNPSIAGNGDHINGNSLAVSPSGGAGIMKEQRRKRKKLNKPWLAEEFDVTRDFNALMGLLVNSFSMEQSKYGFSSKADRLKLCQFIMQNKDDQTHFVVRNWTLSVIYGICFTWCDPVTKTGRILGIVVDRTKRRQSIGEILHSHAIKYLTMDKGCRRIVLGASFPLLGFLSDGVIEDFNKYWKQIESGSHSGSVVSTTTVVPSNAVSPARHHEPDNSVLNFLKSVGWGINRNYNKTVNLKPEMKYVLTLNLDNWFVSENLVKQLQVVGIRFDICKDPEALIETVKASLNTESTTSIIDTNDEENQLLELYNKVSKIMKNEPGKTQINKNTVIITAVEPARGSVVGALVVFNNRSELSVYYPFMNTAFENDDKTPTSISHQKKMENERRKQSANSTNGNGNGNHRDSSISASGKSIIGAKGGNHSNSSSVGPTSADENIGHNRTTSVSSDVTGNRKSAKPNGSSKSKSANGSQEHDNRETMTGGITGLYIDPNYESLTQVFKIGLICTGISYCKQTKLKKLVALNIDETQLSELYESGFKLFQQYYPNYGIKKSYEWVV